MINPHGKTIDYGKHAGKLFTRLPRGYLVWMINEKAPMWEIAKAEFERRGDTMPKVELSGHAIDSASLRIRKSWHQSRGKDEGLYSWLQRMTLEAIEKGTQKEPGNYHYMGLKFVVAKGEEFPALKTVMKE